LSFLTQFACDQIDPGRYSEPFRPGDLVDLQGRRRTPEERDRWTRIQRLRREFEQEHPEGQRHKFNSLVAAAKRRKKIQRLLRAHARETLDGRWAMLADRIKKCGSLGAVVVDPLTGHVRRGKIQCGSRLCDKCLRVRADSRAAAVRPIIEGAMAAGLEPLFWTPTTRHVDAAQEDLAQGYERIGKMLVRMRDSRVRSADGEELTEAWGRLFAGGVTGREATLHGKRCAKCHHGKRHHKPGGLADGCTYEYESWRRNHMHAHVLLFLQPGIDWQDARRWLIREWCRFADRDMTRRFGENPQGAWALPTGQKCTLVDQATPLRPEDAPAEAQRGWNAVMYCLKYPCKASELRTGQDCQDVVEATKGLRLIQTFGCLHKRVWRDGADKVSEKIRASVEAVPEHVKGLLLEETDLELDGSTEAAAVALHDWEDSQAMNECKTSKRTLRRLPGA